MVEPALVAHKRIFAVAVESDAVALTAARDAGATIMKLETGDVLHAAHRLYESQGFKRCDAFPPYNDAGSSIFMEKPLT